MSAVLIVHHVFRPDNTRQVSETGAVLPFEGSALGTVLEAADNRDWACAPEPAWDDVASLAAPIHDGRRVTVGAVGITGAVERICENGAVRAQLVTAVRSCAHAISRELGAERPYGL